MKDKDIKDKLTKFNKNDNKKISPDNKESSSQKTYESILEDVSKIKRGESFKDDDEDLESVANLFLMFFIIFVLPLIYLIMCKIFNYGVFAM